MGDQSPAVADIPFATPPRAVTRLESIMLGAGARLDRFVLQRYLRRTAFPVPSDGDALRARLTRARIFYGDPGFIAHPERFFAVPGPVRADLPPLRALHGGAPL